MGSPRLPLKTKMGADVINSHGRFAWYELITTELEAAAAFYTKVMGWSAIDVSVAGRAYTLFTAVRGREENRRKAKLDRICWCRRCGCYSRAN